MGLFDKLKEHREKAKAEKEERIRLAQEAAAKRMKQLEVYSNGDNLPVSMAPNIILQKNEICHYYCSARRYETKVKTVGYEGGYSGVSVRVAKGVTFHTGGSRGHAVKQQVGVEYPGTIYITSKRIIFLGEKKNFTVNFSKIIGAQTYKDGFGIQTEKTTYNVLVDDCPYVCAIMNGAITNFLK